MRPCVKEFAGDDFDYYGETVCDEDNGSNGKGILINYEGDCCIKIGYFEDYDVQEGSTLLQLNRYSRLSKVENFNIVPDMYGEIYY